MSKEVFTAEVAEIAEGKTYLDQLSTAVIGAAIEVHRALGPGLLESSYEVCLCHELSLRGINFQRQVPIALTYKGVRLDCGYRADLVVEEKLLVELKSIEALLPIHDAQLLSYLKLGKWQLGLIINFNVQLLKQGIRRRVLKLAE